MSKLQKKKPSKDKKKREVDKKKVEATAGAASSAVKASTASGRSGKLEKHVPEAKAGEPNVFQKGLEFLREVKVELKKVTWPSRKQTTGTTIVVIIFVFVVAAFLGLFDYSLSKLVQVVLT